MYTILITFILLIYPIYRISKYFSESSDKIATWIVGPIIAIFLAFLFSGLVGIIANPEKEVDEVTYVKITNMQDNFNTSGNFFLASGMIETETYYYYYYANIHGGYSLGKTNTNSAFVKYSNEFPAKVTTTYTFKNGKLLNWMLPTYENQTYFRVPKGSIRGGYNLDAQ